MQNPGTNNIKKYICFLHYIYKNHEEDFKKEDIPLLLKEYAYKLCSFSFNFDSLTVEMLVEIYNSFKTDAYFLDLEDRLNIKQPILQIIDLTSKLMKIKINRNDDNLNEIVELYYDVLKLSICNKKLKMFLNNIESEIIEFKTELKSKLDDKIEPMIKCCQCHVNDVSILYLPCGHFIICSSCHTALQPSRCSNCEESIEEYHALYI